MIRTTLFAFLALLTSAISARAQGVVELRVVPQSLTQQERLQFFEVYTPLASRRATFVADGERFLHACPPSPERSEEDTVKCAKRHEALLERQKSFNADARAYNDLVLSRLQTRVESLRAALASDVGAIANLNVHRTAGEFDDWTKFALDADERKWQQIDGAVRDAVKSIAIGSVHGLAEKLAKGLLAPKLIYVRTAQASIKKLKAAGINDPALSSAILSLSSTDPRIRRRMAQTILHRLSDMKWVWALLDAGPDKESAQWQAGAAVIGLIAPTPELQVVGQLTLQSVRILFYSVAVHVDKALAEFKVGKLRDMTDQQLQDLRRLTDRMNETGKRLTAARAELAGITAAQ